MIMSVGEIKLKAKRIFCGKYKNISVLTTLYFLIVLIRKTAEITCAYILLAGNFITVDELFMPQWLPWRILDICFRIMEFIMLVPVADSIFRLLCSVTASGGLCRIKKNTFRFSMKTAFMWFFLKTAGFLTFLPSAFLIYSSLRYLSMAYNSADSEAFFIISFYSLIFALISLAAALYLFTGLLLVPFIIIKYPGKNIFSAAAFSLRCMHGNRYRFLKLAVSFLLPAISALLIVTIPFAAAHFLAWYSVFAEDILVSKTGKAINAEDKLYLQ